MSQYKKAELKSHVTKLEGVLNNLQTTQEGLETAIILGLENVGVGLHTLYSKRYVERTFGNVMRRCHLVIPDADGDWTPFVVQDFLEYIRSEGFDIVKVREYDE